MATVSLKPFDVVTLPKKRIVRFPWVAWKASAQTLAQLASGTAVVSPFACPAYPGFIFPGGTDLRFDTPNIPPVKFQSVRVRHEVACELGLNNSVDNSEWIVRTVFQSWLSLTNQILYDGHAVQTNIKVGGREDFELNQSGLSSIAIKTFDVRFNMIPADLVPSPAFSVQTIGAVHSVYMGHQLYVEYYWP